MLKDCAVDGGCQLRHLPVQHKLERQLETERTEESHHSLRPHMDGSRHFAAPKNAIKHLLGQRLPERLQRIERTVARNLDRKSVV